MTILVLSVDRDDDYGEKAGVRGPVVGRQANLDAAVKLALSDPEDSDANCTFGALRAYDELAAEGEDVEIVTITGDKRVGVTSDRKLTRMLDEVLADVKPDRCVFVTDGAEDEFILPLVTSRVRVDTVHRVIVRQHADLEGTYYIIRRALEDEKMQRTFMLPMALALLVYGVFAVLGQAPLGIGAISITIGAYFFVKVLHVGTVIRRSASDIFAGLTSGKVSLFTSLLAILVLLAGVVTGARTVIDSRSDPLAELFVAAATAILWWVIASALIGAAGKVIDAYIREGVVLWNYWTLPFSLVASGLILMAAFDVVGNIAAGNGPLVPPEDFLYVLAGFVLAITGSVTNAFIRQRAEDRGAKSTVPGARASTRAPEERGS